MREIAETRGLSFNKLIAEIDAGRDPDQGLSGALRIFVLNYYRQRAAR